MNLQDPVDHTDHIRGPTNAPITLLEYGDYECPDCFGARLVVAQVHERLEDRLRFVWRHFPAVALHPTAEHAAHVAEAAATQGRFWEMHDKLLAFQGKLHGEMLRIWAGKIGLDVSRFEGELREKTHEETVTRHRRMGERAAVNATPTFFINGVRYTGIVGPDHLYETLNRAGQTSSRG